MNETMTDAERYRLQQAEELLREAGFEPDEHGNWHPSSVTREPRS